MRRYHSEWLVMRRQVREGERLGKPLSAGYYRKGDAYDCGRPRCGIRHREKRFGYTLTRQEMAAELRLREQAEE